MFKVFIFPYKDINVHVFVLYIHVKACEVVWLKCRDATLQFCSSEIQLCVQQALQFLRPLSHSVGTAQFNITLLHTIDRPKSSECRNEQKKLEAWAHIYTTQGIEGEKRWGGKKTKQNKTLTQTNLSNTQWCKTLQREKERDLFCRHNMHPLNIKLRCSVNHCTIIRK